ncbi:MAG TPA: TetR/AcrR family transcriptional regulator [Gemmatimonadaceae bacterium]|nr:TetR/AcrR family transcriptional regulator [Gemmatimonadaceae bacterium]
MSKGELTRQTILEHAYTQASRVGLGGLSIGQLASALELSKSGLFAHFQSKEALQLQILDYAAQRFVERVIRPTLQAPRGEARIRAAFENWLKWPTKEDLGGCFFVAAAAELDDHPGALRDRVAELQRDWLEMLANIARTAITEQQFRSDVDPEQFAHDMYGIMLVTHQFTRLLRDPKANERAWRAFEALVAAARR